MAELQAVGQSRPPVSARPRPRTWIRPDAAVVTEPPK